MENTELCFTGTEIDGLNNWLNLSVALDFTCNGISEYLRKELNQIHHRLKYGPCAGIGNCVNNCSQTTHSLSSWCNSCSVWKRELLSLVRHTNHSKNINWQNISSGKWPTHIDEVAKVYAPHWWTNQTPFWKDLSVGISIIHNCEVFTLSQHVYLKVRSLRNTLAHSIKSISQADFHKSMRFLLKLLQCQEIQNTNAGQSAFTRIDDIITGRKRLDVKEITQKDLLEILDDQKDFQETLRSIRLTQNLLEQNDKRIKNVCSRFYKLGLPVVLAIVFAAYLLSPAYKTVQPNSKSECSSTKTSFSLENPLNFAGFLEDHNQLVGRKWLLDDIKGDLNIQSKGILLTAEMGYGKSALIAHIICSPTESPANEIKKSILYYHFCKFDILITQRSDLFVKQLVSILMDKYPSVGNAIHMDETAVRYWESKNLCSEDPSGFFEYLLVFPLRKLQDEFRFRYIIIDALDECDENVDGKMSLSTLLSNKIERLPNWIKFLLTSRSLHTLYNKFSFLHHYYLNTSDIRNNEDIISFINGMAKQPSDEVKSRIKRQDNGNFLYVVHALQFWMSSESNIIEDIPDSLSRLYALNLQRIFGASWESFALARQTFELLCTSSTPLTETDIEGILNVTRDDITKFKSLQGSKLSHFIQMIDGKFSVYHKAICDFLTDPQNKFMPYYISTTNGHKMFAEHFFAKEPTYFNSSKNIIQLIIHVSESKDENLSILFQKHFKGLVMNLPKNESLMHTFSREKNSYLGTQLLIRVSPSDSVNSLNEKDIIPAFLAAAYGNEGTLEALLEAKGDLYFNIKPPPNSTYFINPSELCKYVFLWGYSLLDIAAQNGHIKVVELILQKDKDLLEHRNSIGLSALHLAAEHGHDTIVRTILNINIRLADQHSLYLAAKNGYSSTISLLLELGARDHCLRCDGTTYWIKENTTRVQIPVAFEAFYSAQIENKSLTLLDDEMFVTCSSALEVAVQCGFIDIVKLLLSHKQNALHCREYGGRTPVLTAVKYNRTVIFEYLISKGANLSDKCWRNKTSDQLKVFMTHEEYYKYQESACINGSGIPYLLAMYGREEMLILIFKNYIKSLSFWNISLENGESLLHIAACRNHFRLISYFRDILSSDINEKTDNGSSPFHSAVVCRSYMSLALLSRLRKDGIMFTDYKDRNLMHYLCKEPHNNNYIDAEEIIAHLLLENLTLSEETHFSSPDLFGNNFYHYAAENGKYNILRRSGSKFAHLFFVRNNKGMNVFDVVVNQLQKTSNIINIPKQCNFTDIFLKSCDVDPEEILTPHEHFLARLLDLNFQRDKDYSYLHLLWRNSLERGNAAAVLFLWKHFNANKPNIDDYVTYLFSGGPSFFVIDLFLRSGNFSCGRPLAESFIHKLLMNEENKYWYIIEYSLKCLKTALGRRKPREWDECFDAEGYNILHRAIMGGNYEAVKFLRKYGMQLTVSPKTDVDFITEIIHVAPFNKTDEALQEIMVFNKFERKQINQSIIVNERDKTEEYDKTATYVVKHLYQKKLDKRIICNQNTESLSLVHLAAAKGMINFVKLLDPWFSRSEINCANNLGLASIYFATIFEQSKVINFLNSKQLFFKDQGGAIECVILTKICVKSVDVTDEFPYIILVQLLHSYVLNLGNLNHYPVLFTRRYTEVKNFYRLWQMYFNRTFEKFNISTRFINDYPLMPSMDLIPPHLIAGKLRLLVNKIKRALQQTRKILPFTIFLTQISESCPILMYQRFLNLTHRLDIHDILLFYTYRQRLHMKYLNRYHTVTSFDNRNKHQGIRSTKRRKFAFIENVHKDIIMKVYRLIFYE